AAFVSDCESDSWLRPTDARYWFTSVRTWLAAAASWPGQAGSGEQSVREASADAVVTRTASIESSQTAAATRGDERTEGTSMSTARRPRLPGSLRVCPLDPLLHLSRDPPRPPASG